MENFTKTIHRRIAQFLNSATAVVVDSYERYLATDLPEENSDLSKKPKQFKEFHDAGKSAAAHLETLLKLTSVTDESEEQQQVADEKETAQILQIDVISARAEIDDHNT